MTTIQDDRVPCPIKGGIWRELARQTAKDRKAVLRELISNAIDAINKRLRELPPEEAKTFVKQIEIIYMKNGGLWCIDNGTGIRDLDKFMEIAKKTYKDDVIEDEYDVDDRIGNFHVGKLSFVIISEIERVIFESVDKNEIGMRVSLMPDSNDTLAYDRRPEYCKAEKILPNPGLIVKIEQVKKKFIMPLDKAMEYVGEVFAPWITFGGFKIVMHYEDMKPEQIFAPVEFGTEEELFSLSDGTKVYGNLKKGKEPGKLFVYKNGVLIQRDMDFRKKMAYLSHVNIFTRNIKTNFARDAFQTDPDDSPIWDEFVEKTAEILEKRKFEDSEKPKRPPINNGKQLENAVLQSLQAIMTLNPFDAPPEFLVDLAVSLRLRQPDDESKKKVKQTIKKLSSKRKKRGKGKGIKGGVKQIPKRKNKKHKHIQEVEKEKPENSDEGEHPPKIIINKAKFQDQPLVFFDPAEHCVNINKDRENFKLFDSVVLSKGAQNEITRAMLRAIPDNAGLSVQEFDMKYYNAIDQREKMS